MTGSRRSPLRWPAVAFAALALLSLVSTAAAAGRDPHLGYVYPAGGERGSSFDVTLGGQYLFDATDVLVSGEGVTTTIVERERQLTPKEQNDLKETLDKLQAKIKKGERLTPDEMKSAADIRTKLVAFGRRLQNPSLGEFVTVRVEVAKDAPLGRRALRLQTALGLSNPLVFFVDDLPEVSKEDWKNVPTARGSMDPKIDADAPARAVTLPCVLNGQIPPSVVDRYRFPAVKGQRLVVRVQARELIPYIADAVPGWFQATVTLKGPDGKELAYDDDWRFHPDPVLFYRIPASGEYALEVRDALYRGREDFVYRIAVGEIPFVTDVFPLGGRVGSETKVAATGSNLLFLKLPLDLTNATPGIHAFPQAGFDNVVLYDADTLPEAFDKEPNDGADAAQAVETPVIVNGRVDRPGDVDVFRFAGKAGQTVVAEVLARRLDSPLDSLLILSDASGRTLAANDDHEDKGVGLETHHADSYLSFTLPDAGDYVLRLADTQHGGGPAYAYRLRISAPRPDFELRATPSSVTLRGGGTVPLAVYALRRDGFAGDIDLALDGAPAGFALQGGRVPGKEERVQVTLSAPPSAAQDPFALRIVGRARIDGKIVVHEAVPADDVMQAFLYRHLVATDSLEVFVLPGFRGAFAPKLLSKTPVQIAVGGTATIEVSLPASPWMRNPQLELTDPPAGLSLAAAGAAAPSARLVVQSDAATSKVGAKGNLIVTVTIDRPGAAAAKNPNAVKRVPLGTLPAIPFEIVAAP